MVSPQRGAGVTGGCRDAGDQSTCQVVKLCPRHYNISRVIRLDAQCRVLWWLPGGYGSSISEFFDEGRDCVVDSDGSKRCLIVFFRAFSMHLPRIQCHRVQSVRRLNSETEFTLRSSPCMPPRHKYQWVTFVPKDPYDP